MPVLGMQELFAAIDKIVAEAAEVSKTVVSTAGADVVREAQANFQGSHPKGKPHVGGAGPNVVTGNLRRSIRYTPPERLGLFEYSTQVGPTAVYGRAVELGYAARNMRPHPYFDPATKHALEQVTAVAEAEWAKFLR